MEHTKMELCMIKLLKSIKTIKTIKTQFNAQTKLPTLCTFNLATPVSWPVRSYLLTFHLLTVLAVSACLTARHGYGTWTNHMITSTARHQKSASLSRPARHLTTVDAQVMTRPKFNIYIYNIFNTICTKMETGARKESMCLSAWKVGLKGARSSRCGRKPVLLWATTYRWLLNI